MKGFKLVVPLINNSSSSSRENDIHTALSVMIADGRWQAGQRLPAERRLCEEFSASRNTLRSVLKKLEAGGIVTIRRGSGCYLTGSTAPGGDAADQDTDPVLMEKLEAAYLFLPSVFANAAPVISAREIAELEECTGRIGRAILDSNWPLLRRKSQQFFSIVSGALNNKVVQEVSCSICASSSFLFPKFSAFAEDDRNRMFADFVLVLKALKARDGDLVRNAIKVKIINVAFALAKLRGIAPSPIIAADRHDQKPP